MIRTTWMAAAALSTVALVGQASAQVNDDAKAVLTESAKTIHDTKSVSFKAKTYATGMLKDIIDLDGSCKIWRDAGTNKITWMVVGRAKDPGKADHKITVVADGTTVKWLDDKENKLFIRPATDTNALEASNMCRELILPEWLSPTPFTMEMTNYPNLAKTGINNVGGEVCDVVEAMPADKSRNRTWSISVKDRLPRQLELGTGNQAQKISKITDITDVKIENFTAKDFEIALPNGYVVDEIKAAPMPPKGDVTPPAPPPLLGLKPGTPAPAFAAQDTSGKQASLADMKGSVVVLDFWGTMFKQSREHSAEMRQLASSMGDKVKFLGVDCREHDGKAASDWWEKSGPGYATIAKGDAIASDYKVAGFPSYCVIDAAGNIVAFYQTFPGAEALKSSIEQAQAAK